MRRKEGSLTKKKAGVNLAPMTRKQALVGLLVILIVIGIGVGMRRAKKTPQVPLVLPSASAYEQIQKTFNISLPTDVERADLKKVGSVEGMGVATRKWQNGKFEFTVLADLPDPTEGKPYQVWLQKDTGEKIFLGNLRVAKGGFLLNFESTVNFSDYKKVIVVETANVLEGSF
jgi:hypothetical protein